MAGGILFLLLKEISSVKTPNPAVSANHTNNTPLSTQNHTKVGGWGGAGWWLMAGIIL
jgi:hypothetical protein